MLKVLWNGRSGLYANQNRLDAISNNIANINTNGYKRMDVAFQDIFNDKMNRPGLPVTNNNGYLSSGSGSKADIVVRSFKDGMPIETDRPEDFAIAGDGFFRLVDDKGNYYYTRDGEFSIDASGNLVHTSGLKLDVENLQQGQLKEPISIDSDGNIISNNKSIGKISVYDFKNRDNMISQGQNLYTSDEQPGKANGKVVQGFLEGSNVDITKELTDMMITQRAYELNSRSVKAADEMWQITNNLRSK